MNNPFSKMGSARRPPPSRWGWLTGLLGTQAIEQRVIENLPSWREFADQKLRDAQDKKDGQRFELPPHRVDVTSPLQWNVLYLLMAGGALGMAYATPTWATYLIYGAIFGVFTLALLVTFRDGLFFHLEAHRLDLDGEMINKRVEGDDPRSEAEKKNDPRPSLLARKGRKTAFRSTLMQIHYQNILRTFESGARRMWVNQEASISDIETLLSQRGMKLAWTLVELLPQLGLLGTLIGLTQMFAAFRADMASPEVSILAGFGTALGATLLANLFVLVLRPLHMRNERAMNEILSTLQMLMAVFILPTQQAVLDRAAATPAQNPLHSGHAPGPSLGERRLSESLEQLSRMLTDFNELHRSMDNGAMAQRSTDIAQDVRQAVRSFRDAFDPKHLEQQQRSFTQLSGAMRELAGKLDHVTAPAPALAAPEPNERMEHDVLQLRVLTRDTLVLLERISGQLEHLTGDRPTMLSDNPRVRDMAFPEPETNLDHPVGMDGSSRRPSAADKPVAGLDPDFGRPRMFRERP